MENAPKVIKINQPCKERWSEMQPQGMGRHCAHCSKVVMDFTKLSDSEIIAILGQPNRSSCGRFKQHQVNRPLVKPAEPTPKSSLFQAFASMLLLVFSSCTNEGSNANSNKHTPHQNADVPSSTAETEQQKHLDIASRMGITLSGRVYDAETHESLEDVSVQIVNTPINALTNRQGNYELKIPHHLLSNAVQLHVSMFGYESTEWLLTSKENHQIKHIYLQRNPHEENILIGDYFLAEPEPQLQILSNNPPKTTKWWWNREK